MERRSIEVMRRTAADRTAAIVTSQSGCDDGMEYVIERKAETRYAGPALVIEYLGDPKHDLTNMQFGELLVVGFVRQGRSTGTHRWMCRCKCGWYIIRKAKYILGRTTVRSGTEIPVMCSTCFDCWEEGSH